jgi:hypothetical protein
MANILMATTSRFRPIMALKYSRKLAFLPIIGVGEPKTAGCPKKYLMLEFWSLEA